MKRVHRHLKRASLRMMSMKMARILTMTAKSRRMSRTSIVRMVLLRFQRLLVVRGRTGPVDRDGRAVDVVVAGGGRVQDQVLVDRRVAAIGRVSTPLSTEAAHLRGPCS